MTDQNTRQAYAANAALYSKDWLDQPAPTDLYALFDRYFIKHGETADIGCGNGRDAAWLAANGYKVSGFDGSPELLAQARKLFPGISFHLATLPHLGEITRQFDNVVCETVIMHLAADDIPPAVQNLQRVMKPGGVVYLSWRVTQGADQRHADGRLYAAFDPAMVRAQMQACAILHFDDTQSLSSGKRICRIIAKKHVLDQTKAGF